MRLIPSCLNVCGIMDDFGGPVGIRIFIGESDHGGWWRKSGAGVSGGSRRWSATPKSLIA